MTHRTPPLFTRCTILSGLILVILLGAPVRAFTQTCQSLSLAWNASPDSSVTGYRLHYGFSRSNYTGTVDAGNNTSAILTNLVAGSTYYFVVTAYNNLGAESSPSNETTATAQAVPHTITSVSYLSNGSLQLAITGSSGLVNSIYASADLHTWKLLKTATNSTGSLVVTDSSAATLSQRYYKVTDASGTTDPAGFKKLPVAGAASLTSPGYSYLGMGLTNAVNYQGTVTSFGTQTLTDTGAPWDDNQFNGTNGEFYIEIVSGSHAGLTSDIISTSGAAKTVTTMDDFSSYLAGGETYKIRKHRTIADVFGTGDQAGLNGGGSVSAADEIRVFNPVTQTYLSYYYQTGGTGGVGWRSSTDQLTDASGTRLYLDQGVLVCRKITGAISPILTGWVKTGPTVVPVGTNLNFISNMYPAGTTTLGNSGLYSSNVATGLAGSTTQAGADEVHICTSTSTHIYYYQTGGSSGTGWRVSTNLKSDASKTTIPAGAAFFIVRKNGRPAFSWAAHQPF